MSVVGHEIDAHGLNLNTLHTNWWEYPLDAESGHENICVPVSVCVGQLTTTMPNTGTQEQEQQ